MHLRFKPTRSSYNNRLARPSITNKIVHTPKLHNPPRNVILLPKILVFRIEAFAPPPPQKKREKSRKLRLGWSETRKGRGKEKKKKCRKRKDEEQQGGKPWYKEGEKEEEVSAPVHHIGIFFPDQRSAASHGTILLHTSNRILMTVSRLQHGG